MPFVQLVYDVFQGERDLPADNKNKLFATNGMGFLPTCSMFVVAAETINWKSLRTMAKVPKHDTMVMVVVTLVTVLTNLAVAVVAGIVIAALVFAWDHAQQLEVEISEGDGQKTYCVHGSLFFASATQFTRFFTPKDDPADVFLKFDHARIMDSSALEAIEALAGRYRDLDKALHVRGLRELRHASPPERREGAPADRGA